MECHFATIATPQVLISKNARQFTSHEFEEFSQKWNFEHVTSSPRYLQANFAEKADYEKSKDFADAFGKNDSDGYFGLILLRNTPRDGHLKTPSERLFSR